MSRQVSLTEYAERLSNWGRWGEQDQRGTLNLITAERRAAAAADVRTGRTVSCSRVASPKWAIDNPQPLLHHMSATGHDSRTDGKFAMADWIGLPIHGFGYTHVDAPSHEAWNGKLYNGRDATMVSSSGAGWASVEVAAGGIVGRAVVLDIPRAAGRTWLPAGTAISPGELDECARAQGVEVTEGDILVVNTGRDARAREQGSFDLQAGTAGLGPECLPWLAEHGVSAMVSDAVHDVKPAAEEGLDMAVHAVGIVAMGLWLVDNAYLEPLLSACAEASRWNVFMSIAPLVLKRSTGSPVNPIAIF